MRWRHDSVLSFLYGEIRQEASDNMKMYSDLTGKINNNAVIPSDILVCNRTGSEPDLAVISKQFNQIALFELTGPVERNQHKVTKVESI